jgi:hypothetical protein
VSSRAMLESPDNTQSCWLSPTLFHRCLEDTIRQSNVAVNLKYSCRQLDIPQIDRDTGRSDVVSSLPRRSARQNTLPCVACELAQDQDASGANTECRPYRLVGMPAATLPVHCCKDCRNRCHRHLFLAAPTINNQPALLFWGATDRVSYRLWRSLLK